MSSDPDRSDRPDAENRDTENRDAGRAKRGSETVDRTAVREALESTLEDTATGKSAGDSVGNESGGNGSTGGEPVSEGPTEDASAARGAADGSGPDRSVLNRVAIRRFTEGVLDAYGGETRKESSGRWSVELPDELAAELGYERATFVFDPADRAADSGDGRGVREVPLAPGTRPFGALCALADGSTPQASSEPVPRPGPRPSSESGSRPMSSSDAGDEADARAEQGGRTSERVGRLHLSSDVLQLHVPPVLEAAGFETTIEDFSPRGSERALAFHFRAQFLSVRSYQREETYTIAVDPATRSVLPTLAARLNAHLPRLLGTGGDDREKGGSEDQRRADRGVSGAPSENGDFDRETVLSAYSAAKSASIEAVEPTVETLRAREEAAVADRIEEIREYYDRRRAELDGEIEAEREAVSQYAEKYDRARNDETRLRYLREQREAEDELAALAERVAERKEELRSEERERIEEATERHRIDVDLELEYVTELSHERGSLSLSATDGEVTAQPTLSYVPATEAYHGLECRSCRIDLLSPGNDTTDDDTAAAGEGSVEAATIDRPRLCVGGHLVCETCARSCRTCGEVRCTSCLDAEGGGQLGESATDAGIEPESKPEPASVPTSTPGTGSKPNAGPAGSSEPGIEPFETCLLCREAVCTEHAAPCEVCGERICSAHRARCEACGTVACFACGEPCEAGGGFHCETHLLAPSGGGENGNGYGESAERSEALYCETHVERCAACEDRRPIDVVERCGDCKDVLCETHRHGCRVCGEVRCDDHAISCEHCKDATSDAGSIATFCGTHAERCAGGGEVVCETHSRPGVIVDGPVCEAHRAACDLCGVRYAEPGFENGRCPACRSLSAETPAGPPVAAIAKEFPAARIGTTPTHAVIRGKQRLRRDEIVVVDRRNGKEVRRSKTDFFGKLSGGA
jgi:hypothetical protein